MEKHIIPFMKEVVHIGRSTKILEVGCDLGGNLKPFVDMDCKITGIDINANRILVGKSLLKNEKNNNKVELIACDIFDFPSNESNKFDIIIMKDTIEHIYNHKKLIVHLSSLLNENGIIFFAFPPWQMPYGGHQQICKSRVLSSCPYIHLLSGFINKLLLMLFNETRSISSSILDTRKTKINIEKFNKLVTRQNLKIKKRKLFLINPNYEIKFNLRAKEQFKVISFIPYLRNFFTTTCYYIISR